MINNHDLIPREKYEIQKKILREILPPSPGGDGGGREGLEGEQVRPLVILHVLHIHCF